MIEIEKVPIPPDREDTRAQFHEFLLTIKSLEVGESFLIKRFTSNYRNSLSIIKVLTGATIRAVKEGDQTRVARTS